MEWKATGKLRKLPDGSYFAELTENNQWSWPFYVKAVLGQDDQGRYFALELTLKKQDNAK